jgi:hypothetical protein
MPASPNPENVERLLRELTTAADAHLPPQLPAEERHIGRMPLRTRASTAAAAALLSRAFGSSQPHANALSPFTLEVIDDAGIAGRQPDLWARVPAASVTRAPGAKALWQGEGGRVLASADTRSLAIFDARSRRALMWYADVASLPGYEHAAPMRDLLHWLHAGSGAFMLHGAAVASEVGGVLIVGPGGRGKSTLATTALLQGFPFAGDDYVVVDPAARRAHGLYLSVKVLAEDAHRYQHALTPASAAEAGEKVALFLAEPPPGFREGLALRALAVPAVGADFLGWRAIGKAQALAALAPSTLFQTSGDREATFAACSALVRALPCVAWNPGPLNEGYSARVAHDLRTITQRGATA